MMKRLTALLLVLSIALSLGGCSDGKSKSTEEPREYYASNQPIDVFAGMEAVHSLQDFTFQLHVSDVDSETGDIGAERYSVSGAWYTSTHQAAIKVELGDGALLTNLVVDADNLYADAGTAARTLSEHYAALGAQVYADEMSAAAGQLKEDVVHFALKEDPWTAWESGRLSQSREGLKKLYEKVKKNNAKRVKLEEHVGKLSLGLGDLQGTLLDILGELTKNKALYQGELGQVLTEDFSVLLDQQSTDAQGLLGEKWASWDELGEELAQLQEAGDSNGWTAKLLACGEKSTGYTLDLTTSFDRGENYCLSVYPAQAQAVAVPEAFVESQDEAENVTLTYLDAKFFLKDAASAAQAEQGTEMTEEEMEEAFGTGDEDAVPVETQPREDYPALLNAQMVTDDGVEVTIPLLAEYESLEGESTVDGIDDVFESSNGYVLEFVSAEKRDAREAAQSNAKMYATEFKESWGYEILQQASEPSVSADGTAAVAGMAYRDEEAEQDVTVITGCVQVPGSECMMNLDLFVYSRSVTDEELRAIDDLMHSLGVETPVEVIRN